VKSGCIVLSTFSLGLHGQVRPRCQEVVCEESLQVKNFKKMNTVTASLQNSTFLQRYVSNNISMVQINSHNVGTYFISCTKHTTVLRVRPFFRDHPCEPVPEENFWTLWCKGRLTEADTPTIRLSATPSGLSSAHLHHPHVFYRLDTLPAATVHWKKLPNNANRKLTCTFW